MTLLITAALSVCLLAEDAALDAASQQLVDDTRKHAPQVEKRTTELVKELQRQIASCEKGRLNARLTRPVERKGKFTVFQSQAAKDAEIGRLKSMLRDEEAVLTAIKEGTFVHLWGANGSCEIGKVYAIRGGELERVVDRQTIVWKLLDFSTSSGGFGRGAASPPAVEFGESDYTRFVLKGLTGADPKKPESFDLRGKAFQCVSKSGGTLTFEVFDTSQAIEALRDKK